MTKNPKQHHPFPPVFIAVLLLVLALPASASASTPEAMLEQATEEIFTALEAERETIRQRPQRLYEVVDEVFGPHVDFPRVSRYVLGKYWRKAGREQKKRFMAEFRLLLVRFYTSALLDEPQGLDELLTHRDTLIRFLPSHSGPEDKKTLVRGQVNLPSGRVVPVSFRLYRRSETWRIYDISVEGISLVTTYRSNFATELRSASLDALIQRLADRNLALREKHSTPAEMAEGAPAPTP